MEFSNPAAVAAVRVSAGGAAMSWTDERVELLKRLWGEGQSASQIAKELGGVTRNAVIGKVHRLGLSNRAGTNAPVAATPAEPPAPAPEPPAPEAEAPQPAPEPEPAAGAEIVDLAQSRAEKAADPAPADPPEPATETPVPSVEGPSAPGSFARRGIIPAGQPLPPQPSANEVSAEALATVREVEKKARRLSLLELTERTCKWPVGDPATDDFWFCGLPTAPGKPYCEAHVAVAFQPMSARRDRRR